ncbi:DUF432 domain-containing protein [Myxococcota bacterium]|nr:DUF432 domain-containing protein [Myxococcota bacterium]MBU1534158.1 DUF432 domain-containing protein [Myxococcota bacterium]
MADSLNDSKTMSGESAEGVRWWGSSPLPEGKIHCLSLGPLNLYSEKLENEWRIGLLRGTDPLESAVTTAHFSAGDLPANIPWERFAGGQLDSPLFISPALADRPVVSRPTNAYYLPSTESVTFFIGTPVWVKVMTAKGNVLKDFPVFRPSDTWFGPTTDQGQLCYASRTFCNVDLASVPYRPHRAVTSVTIKNKSPETIPIEKIKLPVGNLSLYIGPGNRIWTQDITYEIVEKERVIQLRLSDNPPALAPDSEFLSKGREPSGGNLLVQAISYFFPEM